MDELNAAPSSTEPTAEELASIAMGESAQEGTLAADSINLGAHLSRLDAMLAEIERKIGAGIHLFAHEVTAARDHLAKLL